MSPISWSAVRWPPFLRVPRWETRYRYSPDRSVAGGCQTVLRVRAYELSSLCFNNSKVIRRGGYSASIAAVDLLLESHFQKLREPASSSQPAKSVFVIGRPPGHHAGPNGCVPSVTYWKAPGMTSSGFCLLNTVAVAAVRFPVNDSLPYIDI